MRILVSSCLLILLSVQWGWSAPAAATSVNPQVKIETTMGSFIVELNPAKAPITVKNFLKYVDQGFYSGTVFHRVIRGFMIQGGGFTDNMTKKTTDAPIKLEAGNGLSNLRGTLAMARTNVKNSATSQFFVNVVNNRNLDRMGGGYAVFGKVIQGMEVIDQIRNTATTTKGMYQNVPVKTVMIKSATRFSGSIPSSIAMAPKVKAQPQIKAKPTSTNPRVQIETTLGSFTVELDPNKAPITVKNFLKYVDQGFYSGTIFHRVISGFMIQGGGFKEDMTKKTTAAPIKLEAGNGISNLRGTIAMARTNVKDSATSQFFVNVVNNRNLDRMGGGYAAFGKVIEGMDVVDQIRNTATTTKGRYRNVPVKTVVIKSAKRL